MGLLDDLAAQVGGGQPAGGGLLGQLTHLLNDPQHGGLAGLVQQFTTGGLGQVIQSWISTGPNLPVNPAQLAQALGPRLQQMAAALGTDPGALSGQLAKILPEVVNHVTPNGQVPQGPITLPGLSSIPGLPKIPGLTG